jgi:hypothetical protein
MKVKLNKWLEYEAWLGKKLMFEIDKKEIFLGKLCRDDTKVALAHILGVYPMVEMTSREIEKFCLLLSETKNKNKNKQTKK